MAQKRSVAEALERKRPLAHKNTKPLDAINLHTINLYCTSCINILKLLAVMHSSGQAELEFLISPSIH